MYALHTYTQIRQIACRRHFEVTHPGAEGEAEAESVGNHPNAWFDASMRYYTAKEGAAKGGSKTANNATATTSPAAAAKAGPAMATGFTAPPAAPAVAAGGDAMVQ